MGRKISRLSLHSSYSEKIMAQRRGRACSRSNSCLSLNRTSTGLPGPDLALPLPNCAEQNPTFYRPMPLVLYVLCGFFCFLVFGFWFFLGGKLGMFFRRGVIFVVVFILLLNNFLQIGTILGRKSLSFRFTQFH